MSRDQMAGAGEFLLRGKLRDAMVSNASGFDELGAEQREEFIDDALSEARSWGFTSEQAFASYALAMWFLGQGFPQTSRYLNALLQSKTPEVRKVHAMNAWVSTCIGKPDDLRAADDALRQAVQSTIAWGW